MVVVVNVYNVVLGKTAEAEEWLRKFADLPAKKPFVKSYSVLKPISGVSHRLRQVNKFESLAARDEYLKKALEDPQYRALMKEAIENKLFETPPERHLFEETKYI
jgi:hypothetical protein